MVAEHVIRETFSAIQRSHQRDMTILAAGDDSVASATLAGLRYVSDGMPGISRRRRGKGFEYFDPDSRLVRDRKTLQRIRSLVIPPAWKDVWICPLEEGHLQAVGRDARGRKQYRYHPRYRAARDETKFGRMAVFGALLPKIRRQLRRDLVLPGLPQRKVIAAIVQLLDQTCIRVGNDEYARSNNSYGLTTLKSRHADVRGDRMRFRFRGKSNQEHDLTLHDKHLAKIVKKCQDLPGQELFQYSSEGGESVKVSSSDVNDYLRDISQEDFTAKDFRTWHGTVDMLRQLTALGPAASEPEAKRNIAQAVKETAKLLGNRPAACRKYYIHPTVLENYETQEIFKTEPNGRSGSSRTELKRDEAAALRLIKTWTRVQRTRSLRWAS